MSCLCCAGEAVEVEQIPQMAVTEERLPVVPPTENKAPEAAQEAPAAPAAEPSAEPTTIFNVKLEKMAPDTPIGLYLDISDGQMLHVCGMRLGTNPAQIYNNDAPPNLQIQQGDFITKVNGVSGNAKKLVDALTKTTTLELEVQRPITFSVKVNKKDTGMGLDVNYAMQGKSLVVEGLHDGAIKVWNDAHPQTAVQRGDRIVAVDGVEGGATDLLAKLSEGDELELLCSRPVGKR